MRKRLSLLRKTKSSYPIVLEWIEMKTKIKNEKSNSFAIIIGIFFLLSSAVFCGFVVFDNKNNLNSTSGVGEFSSIQKLTELDDVNEHLKSVTDKLEVERLKALVANLKASNEIGLPAKTTTSLNSDQPIVDFSDDPRIYQ